MGEYYMGTPGIILADPVVSPPDGFNTIVISTAGDYKVDAFVNFNGTSAFVFELNGAEITPETLYAQNDATTAISIIFSVIANPDSTLRLKFKDKDTITSTNSSLSASLTIFKLS